MVELSDLADRALDLAIIEAISQRVEGADPRGMIALALGKHGAHELNYSSDIDVICSMILTHCRGASGTSPAKLRSAMPAKSCAC